MLRRRHKAAEEVIQSIGENIPNDPRIRFDYIVDGISAIVRESVSIGKEIYQYVRSVRLTWDPADQHILGIKYKKFQ
jgi:hypothetical protein